jgi:hypothetical protein
MAGPGGNVYQQQPQHAHNINWPSNYWDSIRDNRYKQDKLSPIWGQHFWKLKILLEFGGVTQRLAALEWEAGKFANRMIDCLGWGCEGTVLL